MKTFIIGILIATWTSAAWGGARAPSVIPDPFRSTAGISGQGADCQFRFSPSGDRDVLVVDITLRDAFDNPVANCSTSVVLEPEDPETFCTCCGETQTGFSDANGLLQLSWDRIGGYGNLDVMITINCFGDIPFTAIPLQYTSPDLSPDCGASSTPITVLDLAFWAQGLIPTGWEPADYDCSGGSADILDLALFAGALGTQCSDGPPCPAP